MLLEILYKNLIPFPVEFKLFNRVHEEKRVKKLKTISLFDFMSVPQIGI